MAFVEVIDGAQQVVVPIDGERVTIGRDANSDVRLPGDTTVSRTHAVLTVGPDGWTLTDQGSRNGTFVNGRPVGEPEVVGPSDRIRIGPFVLLVKDAPTDDLETTPAGDTGGARIQVATGLSKREVDVVRLVAAGDSDQQIADALFISLRTVHSHLERIRDKTGCRRRPDLIRFAMDHGIA